MAFMTFEYNFSISELESKTETALNERDQKLSALLELQNRAKWYRAIKEKKYRLIMSNIFLFPQLNP